MTLEAQLEAILFHKSEPLKVGDLAAILNQSETVIHDSLKNLAASLVNRGLCLMWKGDEVSLGTNPEASPIIEQLIKDELSRDLGKASLETLSIILYRGPISRPDIDYIRGVNSSFILRNLMIRGLVERTSNPQDARTYLYQPTFELMSHLGITKLEELPEFEVVAEQVETFKATKEEHESTV
jgi:segregation and condensation protein B